MNAIILAAGMGKRLKAITEDNTKCMVKVNGIPLIERMLVQLDELQLQLIVIVIGYKGNKLKTFVEQLGISTPIEYIENRIYEKTNNIYSLYLARNYLSGGDTLLLESDLIFEKNVLRRIIDDPSPNLALVAKYESWMDGTVVTLDEDNNIKSFVGKNQFDFEFKEQYFKTVNIHKFSKTFSCNYYIPFLEAYCAALGHNEYYEQVLKVIVTLDKSELKAASLANEMWYEIDDAQDLDIAESIFSAAEDKVEYFRRRYGGYWRYPHMLDFCYTANPYYPPNKLLQEIKANFENLICCSPSNIDINNLLVAKYFSIEKEYICTGNGASELIKALMKLLPGQIGISLPCFEEYIRQKKEKVALFTPKGEGLRYTAKDLIDFYEKTEIQSLVLVNPDMPTGNYISPKGVNETLQWCRDNGKNLILDETFMDYADEAKSYINNEVLQQYPNLYVIKSLSKSLGVQGLRLGIVASSNKEHINLVKEDLTIWNINSFAEYYLQIFEKYKSEYEISVELIKVERAGFTSQLADIPGITVFPTQGNFVMCKVETMPANQLTRRLLSEYNLFIRDLSGKWGIKQMHHIGLAIRNHKENQMLIEALKGILSEIQ